MPVSVQYDAEGNITGRVRYPAHKPAPQPKNGIMQKIFADDDPEIQTIDMGRKKMNLNWDGADSKQAFLDRPETEEDRLRKNHRIEDVARTAKDPQAWEALRLELAGYDLPEEEPVVAAQEKTALR